MTLTAQQRRHVLINLLKLQALIGVGFLLWIFFAGDRADDPAANTQLSIDTATMADDSINVVRQKNFDLVIIKPSPQALQQLAALTMPSKRTSAEPPARDYRVSVAVKVFALARVDDHYLLSGRDHWQRDQVCDDLQLQDNYAQDGQTLAFALVCKKAGAVVAYDVAGRSLQADIADLEMPTYRLQDNTLVISGMAP